MNCFTMRLLTLPAMLVAMMFLFMLTGCNDSPPHKSQTRTYKPKTSYQQARPTQQQVLQQKARQVGKRIADTQHLIDSKLKHKNDW